MQFSVDLFGRTAVRPYKRIPESSDSVSPSWQRLSLPRIAGTGLAEGETGQAEPDWPALADWLSFASCEAASLPPAIFRRIASIVL